MENYLVTYSYDGTYGNTYNIVVSAPTWGTVVKNIKKVFTEGVEMTPKEANDIIEHDWYSVEGTDVDYILKEEE